MEFQAGHRAVDKDKQCFIPHELLSRYNLVEQQAFKTRGGFLTQPGAPLSNRRVPGLNNDRREKNTCHGCGGVLGVLLRGKTFCPWLPFWIPRKGSPLGLAASYLSTCPVGRDTRGRGVELNKGAFSQPGLGINGSLFALLPGAQPGMLGWGPGQQVGTQSPELGEP